MQSPEPPRPPARIAALVLFLAFACNMVGRGVGDTFMVFVLPLSGEFGWARADVLSVYSVYLVVTGLAAPLTGVMIDRWGPRVVYPLGLALLGVAMLASAHLTRLWQFQAVIGLFAGMGVSMLGMVPASMLISRWFRNRMATAMGVAYAGFGTGTILLVPLAQRAIQSEGWRPTYSMMGIALFALVPLLFLLPWRRIMDEAPRAAARATTAAPANRWAILREAMRTRAYWQIVQLFAFTSLTTYGVIAQLVPFLVESGLSPIAAASAFGTAGLLSVFGIMASGWAGDRFGFRATVTTTFASTATGILALLAFSAVPAAWLVVAYILTFGLVMGARGPIVSSLAARHFGGPGFATIYGTMFAWMSISGAVGTFMSGLLFDLTGGYQAGFLFSLVTVALAVMPFWTRRPLAVR